MTSEIEPVQEITDIKDVDEAALINEIRYNGQIIYDKSDNNGELRKAWDKISDNLHIKSTNKDLRKKLRCKWTNLKLAYKKELEKERKHLSQDLEFHSSWTHFDRFSFLRKYLSAGTSTGNFTALVEGATKTADNKNRDIEVKMSEKEDQRKRPTSSSSTVDLTEEEKDDTKTVTLRIRGNANLMFFYSVHDAMDSLPLDLSMEFRTSIMQELQRFLKIAEERGASRPDKRIRRGLIPAVNIKKEADMRCCDHGRPNFQYPAAHYTRGICSHSGNYTEHEQQEYYHLQYNPPLAPATDRYSTPQWYGSRPTELSYGLQGASRLSPGRVAPATASTTPRPSSRASSTTPRRREPYHRDGRARESFCATPQWYGNNDVGNLAATAALPPGRLEPATASTLRLSSRASSTTPRRNEL